MKKDWENIPADSLPQELPKTILSTDGMPTAEKEKDADVNAHADAPSSEVREEQRSPEKQGIRVRYNGKDREIPWDKAKDYVEMGLKWESFRASHDTLKELAARAGVNVARFVETLAGGTPPPETGNQTAEGEQTLLDQMNGEFEVLAEAVPDIHSVEDIPEEVFTLAVAQKLPLYDAYLRFRYEEERRQKSEQERQAAAQASSAGSLRDTGETPSPEDNAFVSAFRRAIR